MSAEQLVQATKHQLARELEIDEGTSVDLWCPDCGDHIWLHQGTDVRTLGDVIDAAEAHTCIPEGD